jgi:SAM-dependent methyltransferase
MKQFWDERYSVKEYVYGVSPNSFFKEQIAKLQPGKLLLPGEGEGRNAVYAASLGWNVMAFDTSLEGRKKAMALAQETNVSFEYVMNSYLDFDYKAHQFDAIGLFFTHMPSEMRIRFHQFLMGSLKPGGRLILECFHKEQINRNTGGPANLDFLFSEEELQTDFSVLEIVLLEKQSRSLQEGLFHNGEADLVRLLAIKP